MDSCFVKKQPIERATLITPIQANTTNDMTRGSYREVNAAVSSVFVLTETKALVKVT